MYTLTTPSVSQHLYVVVVRANHHHVINNQMRYISNTISHSIICGSCDVRISLH